jgi:uncharacterized phage protein gp47/JayE
MAIPTIPSITEIKTRIQSDIETAINQTIPALPLSFVKVLSSSIAGVVYLLYQAILWVYKQIFPASADYVNLVLLGAIIGITPTEAIQAIILCDIDGTGAQVDAETLWIGSNNVTYKVTTTTAIVGGTASNVPLLALESGDIGNLANGEILDIVSTDLNLEGTALVVSTDTSGADQESREDFSNRVSLAYRTRNIAGTPGGYALFGLQTPNFIWVGPYANQTLPGTVDVYGRVDNQTDGIPTSAQLTELENYLTYDPDTGEAIRKPIGDIINTIAISVREFELEIFINGGNPSLNAEIETAVKTYITTLEPYIVGVSDTRKNVLTNANVVGVADAIADREGALVTQVIITDTVTTLAETNYTFYGGEFGKFTTVTFTAVP